MGEHSFKYKTSEICNNIIVIKDEACPSKISHKFHKQCLFNFLQNVRPILVVSKYPPLLDTTLLIYRFGLSPFTILVTIPLLELLTYPPLLDTTLLIYRFGLSPFTILVTIPLLEFLTYHSLLDTTLLIYRFGLSPFRILVTIPLLE